MVKARKILLNRPGNRANFSIVEFEVPCVISAHDILVEVHFSGLNFADVMMRLSLYPDAPKAPFTPGYEVSGIVVAVGESITDIAVGDKVMGGSYFGGYCSHVVLPSWQVRKVPESLSLEQAGGLMVSYLTAAFSLFELARVRAQEHVVIDCGSGALGAVLIKLLRQQGVRRITGLTRRESKLAKIDAHGARGMTHDQWRKSSEKADVMINSRGGRTIKADLYRLAPLGRMICLGASNMVRDNKVNLIQVIGEFIKMEILGRPSVIGLMNQNCGIFGLNVLKLFDAPEKIERLLGDEFFSPVAPEIDEVFSYQDVQQAHEKLGSGRSSGKILLSWKSQ
jgi:NADPH:quinone reductase-like Zn-dependent oxidoreductase